MTALPSSVLEIARAVHEGQVSAVEVTQRSLQRIEATQHLGAFLHVSTEAALKVAEKIDQKRASGAPLGPLAGVPIAIKDALCTVDAPTTAASRILMRRGSSDLNDIAEQGYRPPYDATVVERLRQADAILIGKANMDEFAMGSSNENSAFATARNPWDPERIPGGSSGGSAVCVAAGAVAASLGSDTGGSIRLPAALCGIVGVKPSYGRVSRFGLMAFASSLDQVGPMARDARSCARILDTIAGPDPKDSTCFPSRGTSLEAACDQPLTGMRVGVPTEYFGDGIDREVVTQTRAAIDRLQELGATLQEVSLPHTHYGISTYYLIAAAEASSNLSRYDGVRFGLRREERGADIHSMYASTRGQGFGDEVKRRIMLGTYALSSGYYEAYYEKAQRVRTLIRRDFERVFDGVDLLATPICPNPAFKLGERTEDPLSMYMADVLTLPASLAGICGISVPIATTAARPAAPPLPIGLQLLAPARCEDRLFRAAAQWEDAFGLLECTPATVAQ